MPIELVPEPGHQVAAAVRQAVRSARIEAELTHPGYASAWRRAGHEAGVRRGVALRYGATLSPRKARGAIRA